MEVWEIRLGLEGDEQIDFGECFDQCREGKPIPDAHVQVLLLGAFVPKVLHKRVGEGTDLIVGAEGEDTKVVALLELVPDFVLEGLFLEGIIFLP